MPAKPSSLLLEHQDLLGPVDRSRALLDLACGNGRNGLALAARGYPVVFADRSGDALANVERALAAAGLDGRTWQVDLEREGVDALAGRHFGAIVCFRYLHRPLFPALRRAVVNGGLVIYQTFTVGQPRYGRPHNPDFLLRPGELPGYFQGWEFIHRFEGVLSKPERSVAQIVARKPR